MHNMQDKLQDIITGQPAMETIVAQLMMTVQYIVCCLLVVGGHMTPFLEHSDL